MNQDALKDFEKLMNNLLDCDNKSQIIEDDISDFTHKLNNISQFVFDSTSDYLIHIDQKNELEKKLTAKKDELVPIKSERDKIESQLKDLLEVNYFISFHRNGQTLFGGVSKYLDPKPPLLVKVCVFSKKPDFEPNQPENRMVLKKDGLIYPRI